MTRDHAANPQFLLVFRSRHPAVRRWGGASFECNCSVLESSELSGNDHAPATIAVWNELYVSTEKLRTAEDSGNNAEFRGGNQRSKLRPILLPATACCKDRCSSRSN